MAEPVIQKVSLHPMIYHRWSPKAFSSEPVAEELLESLFEAARWAPSCFNEQPWHFIVGDKSRNKEQYSLVLSCFNADNQIWALNAPVLMLTVAKLFFQHNSTPNPWAWHDIGLAVANMTLQANHCGLYVCEMAGINPEAARIAFNIPEGYQVCSGLVVGYMGKVEDLPEPIQKKHLRKRWRKEPADFVHLNGFQPKDAVPDLNSYQEMKPKVAFDSIEELMKS